ncbi:MAG: YlxR family protein [Actinomycetota bacterium]
MSADAGPHRTCVGCRGRRHIAELVRVTYAHGCVELGGASCGRGAWICCEWTTGSVGRSAVDTACLDAAMRRSGFQRAWRIERRALDTDELLRVLAGSD